MREYAKVLKIKECEELSKMTCECCGKTIYDRTVDTNDSQTLKQKLYTTIWVKEDRDGEVTAMQEVCRDGSGKAIDGLRDLIENEYYISLEMGKILY